MNGPQLKKSGAYDLLSLIVGKPKGTLKMFFCRNKLDITDKNDILQYLSKYYEKHDNKANTKIKE